MKVLGRIGGNEIVLDKDDGNSALTLVTEFPDPTGDIRSIQIEVAIDGYKPGDIFVSDGTAWKKVELPTRTIGSVTGMVYPRIGCDVQIRWADPVDEDPYVWKHTRLMRKYGSDPTSIYDGVVVTDSYVRDRYRHNAYHDYVPAGTEEEWHYRFFTCSEDGVWHTDDDCVFMPIELSWATITNIVRNGWGHRVFQLGDTVTINVDSDDETYKKLEFEVVKFNGMTMEDLNLTHSISFASVNVVGVPVRFDSPWPEYMFTADQYITSRTKVYYAFVDGEFVQVTNLRVGSRIPPNTYYEKSGSDERITKGGNRWARSSLRKWMNSTDPDYKIGDMVPPLTAFDSEVVATITSVRNKTMYPICDGTGAEIVLDKIYLLSQTEVFNINPKKVDYLVTHDDTPKETYEPTKDESRVEGKVYFLWNDVKYIPASEADFNEDGSFKEDVQYFEAICKDYFLPDDESPDGYRKCEEEDYADGGGFKPDTVYYDQIVTEVEENKPCPQFSDEELEPRIKTDRDGVAHPWWLRTADIFSETGVKVTNSAGELTTSDVGDATHHVVLAFTVA